MSHASRGQSADLGLTAHARPRRDPNKKGMTSKVLRPFLSLFYEISVVYKIVRTHQSLDKPLISSLSALCGQVHAEKIGKLHITLLQCSVSPTRAPAADRGQLGNPRS